ncbi:MAG: glycosyltransferase [Phycisphaerales bacterium]|nr:glycosyltransferase [Phycisphaerales bacterium]
MKDLRIWLVHDWLTGMRGGEKVLLELVKLFPRSRIATLVHAKGTTHPEIDRRVERVSFLNRMPGVAKGWRNYLPLYPAAVRSLKLDGERCDAVISVSHAVAKGVRAPRGVPHICYCLTPMRYIWGMEDQYVSRWSWKRAALMAVRPYLRNFDVQNEGVTEFVVLSEAVQERVRKRYGRESRIVYPGIDIKTKWQLEPRDGNPGLSAGDSDFYLMVSALVPYKRIDLAVEAFAQTGRKLVVIGKGPELGRLKKLARKGKGTKHIEFLGWQSDESILRHYQQCKAFIFPGEEDFGLTVVEAQACGKPVIAYGAGGALETVTNETGLFFSEQTVEGLIGAIEQFERKHFDVATIRQNAMRFTWEGFREGMMAAVNDVVAVPLRGVAEQHSGRLCVKPDERPR